MDALGAYINAMTQSTDPGVLSRAGDLKRLFDTATTEVNEIKRQKKYWSDRTDELHDDIAKLQSERPECHDCKWARRGEDGVLYKCLAGSLDCRCYTTREAQS